MLVGGSGGLSWGPSGLQLAWTPFTELRAGEREVRWGWEVLSQADRPTDRVETAPKLSHGFNFSHLNLRQRMSNSGPCPDSHTLPPGSRPLSLLLPTPTSACSLWMAPNLTLTLWDPHFLCLSWRGMGLSPLTHPVDGPPHTGYSAAFVHMGTRLLVYLGVRAGGQEAWLSFWGLHVP